ncbi:PEP-CTERM sorting domain-containing protein [Crocosphaera sp.]|uniref:PEP-CTERM sorting domain-containing protein n=1 Tax=Crocosphaera sp. TaxID=2729996 RepID=UPI003F205BCD|nr:PEP-CTERM sorting domain-containing protein [Crocosphaera sp.]
MNYQLFYPFTTLILSISLSMLATPKAAEAAFFTGLGDLEGADVGSAAFGVSADGTVIAGQGFSTAQPRGEAFRWTAQTDLVPLGDLPGDTPFSVGFGISGDGQVVVGFTDGPATDSIPGVPEEAFFWTEATGLIGLGDLPGGSFNSLAADASFDGSVIVGRGASDSGFEALFWTEQTGLVGLGDLPGGVFNSIAFAVSRDGSVIAGTGASDLGTEAFRWTTDTGMVGLGDLSGGTFFSRAADVSADGEVVVGRSDSENSIDPVGALSGTEAFRWTADTGMVGLGDLPGGAFFSRAAAVSANGSVIVGRSQSALGLEPFIWTETLGMQSLLDVFARQGIEVSDWSNWDPLSISDDGLTIVGSATNPDGNPEAWIAQLDELETVPESSSILGVLTLGIVGLSRKVFQGKQTGDR